MSHGLFPFILISAISKISCTFRLKLAQKLRGQSKKVVLFYGKPSKALEYANSYKIQKVIFIGKEEVKKGKFKVKNMKTGKESYEKF